MNLLMLLMVAFFIGVHGIKGQLITVGDEVTVDNSSLLQEMPSSRVSKYVTIWLWTRENPLEAVDVTSGMEEVTLFDAQKPTFVLMHGWGNTFHSFSDTVYPGLLASGDCNILAVNWEAVSPSWNYLSSVRDSMAVGEFLGAYVSGLIWHEGLQHKNLHLIGFGLGAHGVGHLGRTIHKLTGSKVARLTGLEPVKPVWDLMPRNKRLSREDAEFVVVIHTNSGLLVRGEVSFFEDMGHVDFYPNGGRRQPGCFDHCLVNCDDATFLELFGVCSHARATKYLRESMTTSVPFVARKCGSWSKFVQGKCNDQAVANISLYIDPMVRGTFFLPVNDEEPFATGTTEVTEDE